MGAGLGSVSLVPRPRRARACADIYRGDLAKLNIASHDPGAQLDSAGHKPEGATVQAGGKTAENWVVSGFANDTRSTADMQSMMSSDTFCLRACLGDARSVDVPPTYLTSS